MHFATKKPVEFAHHICHSNPKPFNFCSSCRFGDSPQTAGSRHAYQEVHVTLVIIFGSRHRTENADVGSAQFRHDAD
jgi:hypothetical protein